MSGARTALVLIDLQHWIVAMPWAPITGTGVVEAAAKLRDRFTDAGDSVVLVRYLRADGQDGGPDARDNALVPAMRPREGEHLVTKHGLDAFDGTDLDAHLRGLGVGKLVVAGLSTAHGVAATVATAVAESYGVTVAAYATASVSEAEHTGTLDRLAALGARIATAEEAKA